MQDGFFIAILTGSFTIIGIILGTVLGTVTEYFREKKQHLREMEKRKNETDEEINRNYLSPLCFHLSGTLFLSPVLSGQTFQELGTELAKLKKMKDEVQTTKELMEKNMHVLPWTLNLSLIYFFGTLKGFVDFSDGLSQVIEKASEKDKKTKLSKDFLENLERMIKKYNTLATEMVGQVYGFMKFNISPDKTIDHEGVTKELLNLSEAMKSSLRFLAEKP